MIEAGTKLGRYEIRSKLGAGGMGEVYQGRNTQLGRDVAVKVLPTTVSTDPDRLRRFEQEAGAASALNHPNIQEVAFKVIPLSSISCMRLLLKSLVIRRTNGRQRVY